MKQPCIIVRRTIIYALVNNSASVSVPSLSVPSVAVVHNLRDDSMTLTLDPRGDPGGGPIAQPPTRRPSAFPLVGKRTDSHTGEHVVECEAELGRRHLAALLLDRGMERRAAAERVGYTCVVFFAQQLWSRCLQHAVIISWEPIGRIGIPTRQENRRPTATGARPSAASCPPSRSFCRLSVRGR